MLVRSSSQGYFQENIYLNFGDSNLEASALVIIFAHSPNEN